MRMAREAHAIILTEEEAQALMASERGKSVRVWPLKDMEGRWFIAPNVARDRKTQQRVKIMPRRDVLGVVTLLEEDGDGDDVRVQKIDGTDETKTTTRRK